MCDGVKCIKRDKNAKTQNSKCIPNINVSGSDCRVGIGTDIRCMGNKIYGATYKFYFLIDGAILHGR